MFVKKIRLGLCGSSTDSINQAHGPAAPTLSSQLNGGKFDAFTEEAVARAIK